MVRPLLRHELASERGYLSRLTGDSFETKLVFPLPRRDSAVVCVGDIPRDAALIGMWLHRNVKVTT